MTEQLTEGERNLKAQMENMKVLAAEEKMKQMLGG